ncbi:hypothetical protein C8Q76DRAFT_690325 [Earliella scabrosa]|nr:hypothetical protein C8Q76DRAFT_690325 [Earliella scabrosa]
MAQITCPGGVDGRWSDSTSSPIMLVVRRLSFPRYGSESQVYFHASCMTKSSPISLLAWRNTCSYVYNIAVEAYDRDPAQVVKPYVGQSRPFLDLVNVHGVLLAGLSALPILLCDLSTLPNLLTLTISKSDLDGFNTGLARLGFNVILTWFKVGHVWHERLMSV